MLTSASVVLVQNTEKMKGIRMKLHALSFGSAGAFAICIWYSIAACALKLWPQETLSFIGASHMIPRLENIAPYLKISWMGIITGLAIHCFFGFVFFWVIATLYNAFSPNKE